MRVNHKFKFNPIEIVSNIEYYSDTHHLLRLLNEDCTHWWDTKDLTSSTQQTLASRIDSADVLTMGDDGTVETADPVRLVGGVTSAYVPNSAGNYLRKAFTVPADQSTLEVIYRIKPHDVSALIHPVGTGSTHLNAQINTSGILRIRHLNDSLDPVGDLNSPSAIPGYTAGTWYWIRMRLTVSSALCEYWYSTDDTTSPDNVTWVSLGSGTGSNAGTTLLQSNITRLLVGSYSTGLAPGAPHSIAYVSYNWGGSDIRSWACDEGLTTNDGLVVTRSTSGYTTAIVTRPLIMLDGSDDHMLLPTSSTPTFTRTTGQRTELDIVRRHNDDPGSYDRWTSYESGGNDGFLIRETNAGNSSFVSVGDGTPVTDALGNVTTGSTLAIAAVVNAGTLHTYTVAGGLSAGEDFSGLSSDPTFAQGKIGVQANNDGNANAFQWFGKLIFNRALTEAELDLVSDYLLGDYS